MVGNFDFLTIDFHSKGPAESMVSSEDEDLGNVQASESEDDGLFGFKRSKGGQYHMVGVLATCN